jgi:hypothetical protein
VSGISQNGRPWFGASVAKGSAIDNIANYVRQSEQNVIDHADDAKTFRIRVTAELEVTASSLVEAIREAQGRIVRPNYASEPITEVTPLTEREATPTERKNWLLLKLRTYGPVSWGQQ